MVVHEQPVTNLAAIAVNRKFFPFQGVVDHQRNEFFRELVRPVIVGTVGREHRQAEGVAIGSHQVIGSRLRCRVRRIGRVGRLFGERPVFAQAAVDLIGGNMQESE